MFPRVTYLMVVILLLLAFEVHGQAIRRCAGCNKMLFGDYLDVEGCYYHSMCFTCAACGRAISGSYYSHLSEHFHRVCYEKRFRTPCCVCGQLIKDEYYEDYWGRCYCAGHRGSIPACDFCDRLVAGSVIGRGLLLPDGRRLCGVCRPSAVTSESVAKELMCKVAARMKSFGLTIDCTNVTVLLLGQEKLKELMPNPRHCPLGFTEYAAMSNGERKPELKSFNVLLLHGMPSVQAESVLAHELMHVWLFDRDIVDIDEALREGSCCYASYLFLNDVGSAECKYIIHNMVKDMDPVYGRGFREVKQFAEANGVAAWLQMLRE